MSHRLRGFSLFMLGDLSAAEEHLRHSLELYDPAAAQRTQESGVRARSALRL